MRIESIASLIHLRLLGNMRAQDLELRGDIERQDFPNCATNISLTAPQLAFGKSLFMGVRAEGRRAA